jgi:phenylalanine-4-hydroxylase
VKDLESEVFRGHRDWGPAAVGKPLSRAPQVASPSPEGTPGSEVVPPTYFDEQHETWRTLCRVQAPAVSQKACDEYLAVRDELDIDEERIPTLVDLDRMLRQRTGWRLVRADGYIPPEWFFRLLADRCFPCMDQVRNAREVLYTSEPDMFHDVIGHLPILASPIISEYYQLFGRAGVHARHVEQTACLDKIYWYSMEFGILNPDGQTDAVESRARVYGAGLITAPTEIFTSLSQAVERRPFSIDAVSAMNVDIRTPNTILFEVRSLDVLAAEFVDWARQERLL